MNRNKIAITLSLVLGLSLGLSNTQLVKAQSANDKSSVTISNSKSDFNPSREEVKAEFKKIEQKYGVKMYLPPEGTKVTQLQSFSNESNLKFNSFEELENFIEKVTSKKENKVSVDHIKLSELKNDKASNSKSLNYAASRSIHRHFEEAHPYEPYALGSAFVKRHIEYDLTLDSEDHLLGASSATSYSTGLNAATWTHRAGWLVGDSADSNSGTIKCSGTWYVGVTVGSVNAGTSWPVTWECHVEVD